MDHETHNESSVVGRIPEFDLIFEKQEQKKYSADKSRRCSNFALFWLNG